MEVRSFSTNLSSVSNHINVSPNRQIEDFVQQSSEVEETSRLDSKLINLTDENDDESCFSSLENDEVQAALSDGDSELLRKTQPSVPSEMKGNIKRLWAWRSVNKPISEKDLNNELAMTMKSLRKEFQDLNQAMQKKRKHISTGNDEDKLFALSIVPKLRRIGERSLSQIVILQVLAKFKPLGQEVSYQFVPPVQRLGMASHSQIMESTPNFECFCNDQKVIVLFLLTISRDESGSLPVPNNPSEMGMLFLFTVLKC